MITSEECAASWFQFLLAFPYLFPLKGNGEPQLALGDISQHDPSPQFTLF